MNQKRILGAVTGVVLLGAVTAVALFGCSGLFGPDPNGIAVLEQSLAAADPAAAADLLIQGSVDAGSVRFGCATALGGLAGLDPAPRAARIADAFDGWTTFCPSVCADRLPALLDLAPPKDIATTVAKCDARGPDPVFGGPLSGLRRSMPPMDYLAVRTLTARADAVSPTFVELHPKLAVGLALKGRPTETEPGADLTLQSTREIDEATLSHLQDAIRACGPETVVSHRVVVDPDGRVAGVAGAASGSPCVATALEALTLPPDGTYAVVDLVWKPEPLPRGSDGGGGGGGGGGSVSDGPSIDGALALDEVETVIRAHMGNIRYCYEKQLTRNESLTGDVVVQFSTAPTGLVTDVDTISSSFRSATFRRCIEKAFAGWRFPRAPGPTTVTWPMHFKTP